MYTRATNLPNLYIRNIIPGDMGIPLLGYRALSGWGEAVFLYLRGMGILGSSPVMPSAQLARLRGSPTGAGDRIGGLSS